MTMEKKICSVKHIELKGLYWNHSAKCNLCNDSLKNDSNGHVIAHEGNTINKREWHLRIIAEWKKWKWQFHMIGEWYETGKTMKKHHEKHENIIPYGPDSVCGCKILITTAMLVYQRVKQDVIGRLPIWSMCHWIAHPIPIPARPELETCVISSVITEGGAQQPHCPMPNRSTAVRTKKRLATLEKWGVVQNEWATLLGSDEVFLLENHGIFRIHHVQTRLVFFFSICLLVTICFGEI